MKRYIRSSEPLTIAYNAELGDRFVAYCRKAGCPTAHIAYSPDVGLRFISGVRPSKLDRLVSQFKSALAKQGEYIIFELEDTNRIIRLEFDKNK